MAGILIAVLLVASLLLAHFSVQTRPLSPVRPLDLDQGLPLPDLGQASTVFSLTALFGAYFAIYLLVGLSALIGVAVGTAASLFLIRHWVKQRRVQSYEEFVLSVLGRGSQCAVVIGLFLAFVQCAYATSELLILREIGRVLFGVKADHATLLAIGTGLVGYFYVLFGGYLAVFRTDVLQFALITVMGLAYAAIAFLTESTWPNLNLTSRPGYWELPVLGAAPNLVRHAYEFVVGAVMGFGFLIASPDAWKRVFIVTALRKRTLARFLVFICVGFMPFVILLPVALHMTSVPDGVVDARQLFSGFLYNEMLFIFGGLGLIACFLSSFDSALVASVHLGLIVQRTRRTVKLELERFYWLMAAALMVVLFLFQGALSLGNPYLLANLLLGPYAVLSGILVGTGARPSRLPYNAALWIVVIGFTGWFLSFVAIAGMPRAPTTYQINTVQSGVAAFLVIALSCRLLLTRAARR